MFNFSDMLTQYEQPITIVTETNGAWNTTTGQWTEGTLSEVHTNAPVLPVSPDDVRHDSLAYDINDRKLYLHSHLDNGQKVKLDVVNASANLTQGDAVVAITASITGLAGNGIKAIITNTGEAGFAASYNTTTRQIVLNLGGDTSVTCEDLADAIDGLPLFSATTTKPDETYTTVGLQVTLAGGYDVEFTVMGRRDYSHHANGLRIYILRRSDAGD